MKTLLCQIACDFLIPGAKEPLAFLPEGATALRLGAELSGELSLGLEEVLELTYWLDGRGDSRAAASAIRVAIAGMPEAAAALGVEGALDESMLVALAKRQNKKSSTSVGQRESRRNWLHSGRARREAPGLR